MDAATRDLLLDITHCPVVELCKSGAADHPCAKVVSFQSSVPLARHQVPEPWDGDLGSARVLFVSSNPSISDVEAYPTWDSTPEERLDFFHHRFGGGDREWVRGGRTLLRDSTYSPSPVAYLRKIHARAVELLGPSAEPGHDYALTEVVRCKSRRDFGVTEARNECAPRYLKRTIEIAAAPVIVVIGEKARAAVVEIFGGPERRRTFGPLRVGAVDRTFISLGAPNSADPQKVAKCLSASELQQVQSLLTAGDVD